MENKKKISINHTVLDSDEGNRVDQLVARKFPEYSRAHIQKWIKEGDLLVNGKKVKARQKVNSKDIIIVDFWEDTKSADLPEEIPIEIIFEDEDLIILNKPAGLVVHPGSGNNSGTLVNALLNHDESLGFLPRAGIVHRLDKDTSGLMVVSKTESSYLHLVQQLKERTVNRTYLALVVGTPVSSKTINEPIGRHPKIRTKQAVSQNGKEAITRYSLVEDFNGYSLLRVNLETGRTHQIRVHLSHMGNPIIGDPLYGNRNKFSTGTSEDIKKFISSFKRQALHAEVLELIHPTSKKLISFQTEIPSDMANLIEAIRG
jgi:23S rRNA pseudouridine1911/1915/1917 synthase